MHYLSQQLTEYQLNNKLIITYLRLNIQMQDIQHQIAQDIKLKELIDEEVKHIYKDFNSQSLEDQYYGSNVYFDKQLKHLVVSEEFNFKNISEILTQAFRQYKIDTSEKACRLRWAFIHKHRNNLAKLKEKEKQQKRERSVAAFSSPYSLYSVDQLIQNLQRGEKQKGSTSSQPKLVQPAQNGYNIFKDSFRKIDNMEEYNELQAKMKQALKKAQEDIYEQKPLFFTPQYEKHEQFEVKSEELTADKVRQLMAYQIQMEKISRQFQVRKQEDQERKYQQIIKKRIQKQRKEKHSQLSAEIEQNWDDYESD